MKNLLLIPLVGCLVISTLVECRLFPLEFRFPLGGQTAAPGDIWPKPLSIHTTGQQYTLNQSRFQFSSNLDDASCPVIQNAFRRYSDLIFLDSAFRSKPTLPLIELVNVLITDGANASCGYPQHNEDESYSIEIPLLGKPNQAQIQSKTVWGALRGLESFSQLVYANDQNQLLVNKTLVKDAPRFQYRGILLDTSRHYLPKKILFANLDAMAYNKMNVFHWHLVDDQSFPFVSQRFPKIHEQGAYSPSAIYTPKDVQDIIEYARMRGIRVIPELDTPAHTHAMARAYPELLTPCYKNGKPFEPDFTRNSETEILNPMRAETFTFMSELFSEFKQTFRDSYIHLGMDEVVYNCWKSNPEIGEFMAAHNMTEYYQVEEYYVKKTLVNVKNIGYKYIIWQDPVDHGVTLAPDSVVAVWKDASTDDSSELHWQNHVSAIAKKNYQIILSACWYLNYISYQQPGNDWEKYYACDPRDFNGTEAEKALVIGGQANMWGEFVDQTNVLSRLWPRASAVAERLWSDVGQTRDVETARQRLDVQRCRMLRRGIPAAPIINGYCGDWEIAPSKEAKLKEQSETIDFGARTLL